MKITEVTIAINQFSHLGTTTGWKGVHLFHYTVCIWSIYQKTSQTLYVKAHTITVALKTDNLSCIS